MSRIRTLPIALTVAVGIALTAGGAAVASSPVPRPAAPSPVAAAPSRHPSPVAHVRRHHPSLTARYGAAPRMPLGATPAQVAAAMRPYNACVHDQGGDPTSFSTANSDPGLAAAVVTPVMRRAERVCAPLQPKPVWQYDAANPAAPAFVGAVVACLKDAGVAAARGRTDADGTLTIDLPDAAAGEGLRLVPGCEQVALRR